VSRKRGKNAAKTKTWTYLKNGDVLSLKCRKSPFLALSTILSFFLKAPSWKELFGREGCQGSVEHLNDLFQPSHSIGQKMKNGL